MTCGVSVTKEAGGENSLTGTAYLFLLFKHVANLEPYVHLAKRMGRIAQYPIEALHGRPRQWSGSTTGQGQGTGKEESPGPV